MLGEQRAHFGLREVAEAQGSGLDVERAATGDHGVLRGGLDPIVADVSHPAEHDAVREALGPLVITAPQLAQHRYQRVADQGVDLVDQQHQRLRVSPAPAGQCLRHGTAAEGRDDV